MNITITFVHLYETILQIRMRYRGDHSPPLHSKRRRGSLAQLGELLQNLGSRDRERHGGGINTRRRALLGPAVTGGECFVGLLYLLISFG